MAISGFHLENNFEKLHQKEEACGRNFKNFEFSLFTAV
jgi:hypothetical protein